MPQITIKHLQSMKEKGEKITVLTLYDASFAKIASESGVDILFVGDSLGMTIQGETSTLPVQIEHMSYHTRCVAQGNVHSLIMSDLPFMSYYSEEIAFENAKDLIQAGAAIVKLEGGEWVCPIIEKLSLRGIPVCGHIGLMPQSIHSIGGFHVQGRQEDEAERIRNEAKAIQKAGAKLLVLECVPEKLAQEITECVAIPVIGIGAGSGCDGQVLVLYDILGITREFKFTHNFLIGQSNGIPGAISAYVNAVKQISFPTEEHAFI